MLEAIPDLPDNVVGFVAHGDVTKDDYEQTLMPAVDQVLQTNDKVRILYVLGADFTGYSAGAMWEDGKLGTEHISKWERIAVVADQSWIRHAVNLVGHLMPGKVKVFELAQQAEAAKWVAG